MTPFLLALLIAFPSTSKTAWMRPESFHLTIGMPRAEALQRLTEGGWSPKPGKDANHLVVDYTDASSLTLDFRKGRLHSVRFEFFAFLQDARAAFVEEREYLQSAFGTPKKLAKETILLYDRVLPNVMAVLSADPKSDNGKKGLGVVVVRYYDPRE
jgi:hypothetical protein